MVIYYISSGHRDGFGGNMRHLIKANIYAKSKKYIFVNYCNPDINHSQPFYKIFSLFTEYKKLRDIPENAEVIVFGDQYHKKVQEKIQKGNPQWNYKELPDSEYLKITKLKYDPELREYHQNIFHQRNNDTFNLCHKDLVNIAVHIRRGDVKRLFEDGSHLNYKKRLTADDVYIKGIKLLARTFPKNKILIFSEGEEADFQAFKELFPEAHLQIDPENWRDIIKSGDESHPEYEKAVNSFKNLLVSCGKAEFFIGSKSHLSHLLAYVNKNISFFESYFDEDLSNLKNIYLLENILGVVAKLIK